MVRSTAKLTGLGDQAGVIFALCLTERAVLYRLGFNPDLTHAGRQGLVCVPRGVGVNRTKPRRDVAVVLPLAADGRLCCGLPLLARPSCIVLRVCLF
jgi:hypothetical protein